jgi:hypothetical protein
MTACGGASTSRPAPTTATHRNSSRKTRVNDGPAPDALPRHLQLLTRELVYTALTRARDIVVLVVEGNKGLLRDLSQPSHSETARPNTNLFTGSVRAEAAALPFAEHLVYRTTKGASFSQSPSS